MIKRLIRGWQQVRVSEPLGWLALVALLFASAMERDCRAQQPQVARFSTGKDGRFFFVPVVVAGKECRFLLDTGSKLTVHDLSLRPQLGERTHSIEVTTAAGRSSMDLFQSPPSRVGRFDLVAPEVLCRDLSEGGATIGERFQGILGMDNLKRFTVTFYADAGELEIAEHCEPNRAGFAELPLYFDRSGRPMIDVSFDGLARQPIALDTGATRCSLSGAAFDLLLNGGEIQPTHVTHSMTLSGVARMPSGVARGMWIGPFRREMVRVEREATHSLGMQQLSRFDFVLNFPDRVAYFRPAARFDQPESLATSGIALAAIGQQFVIRGVREGSPASASGLLAGDVILNVDGRDVGELDIFALGQYLTSAPGRTVHLTVDRGGERIAATVVLASVLGVR